MVSAWLLGERNGWKFPDAPVVGTGVDGFLESAVSLRTDIAIRRGDRDSLAARLESKRRTTFSKEGRH